MAFKLQALKQLERQIRVQNYTKQTIRQFHNSKSPESALIVGGFVAVCGSVAVRYSIKAYQAYKESQPPAEVATTNATEEKPTEEVARPSAAEREKARAKARKANGATGETSWFTSWFAKSFYDGGFEDKMTRREAALILGVRETATLERIKDAHRRVLILNHPDRGGSAFLAAKINEAKDLLLKGK